MFEAAKSEAQSFRCHPNDIILFREDSIVCPCPIYQVAFLAILYSCRALLQ